jgi:hypothetical protein
VARLQLTTSGAEWVVNCENKEWKRRKASVECSDKEGTWGATTLPWLQMWFAKYNWSDWESFSIFMIDQYFYVHDSYLVGQIGQMSNNMKCWIWTSNLEELGA